MTCSTCLFVSDINVSAVGAIMYTMTCTHPDVAYALGVTSRYQANPGEEHWKVVKTILKYLRRTKDQFLIYGDSELKLKGYTNASFASDKDDSKSISGYVFTLNGGAVSWKSSKQAMVADSTIGAWDNDTLGYEGFVGSLAMWVLQSQCGHLPPFSLLHLP